MNCPQCNSADLRVAPFETADPSTGYSDYGVLVTCRTCGAVSTEAEMEQAAKAEDDLEQARRLAC